MAIGAVPARLGGGYTGNKCRDSLAYPTAQRVRVDACIEDKVPNCDAATEVHHSDGVWIGRGKNSHVYGSKLGKREGGINDSSSSSDWQRVWDRNEREGSRSRRGRGRCSGDGVHCCKALRS